MLMMGDKKKAVMAILGPPKKAEEEKGEEVSPLHVIAEELIDAVHANDAAGVAACFEAAFAHCESSEGETVER